MKPSNDRDWLPNVARTPWATVDGDIVTVHNIRNFTYRTETDFTPAWYDKSYDLSKLEGIDHRGLVLDGPGHRPRLRQLCLCRRRPPGDVDRDAHRERRRLFRPSRASSASTSSITWWPMSATSSACAPTTAATRPRTSTSTGSRATPRAANAFFLEYIRQINSLEGPPRVLQQPDDQLHHQHLDELARQSGPPALELEDTRQRSCAGIPVRERPPGRRWPAFCGPAAPRPCQRPGARPRASWRTSRNASANRTRNWTSTCEPHLARHWLGAGLLAGHP